MVGIFSLQVNQTSIRHKAARKEGGRRRGIRGGRRQEDGEMMETDDGEILIYLTP